MILLSEQSFLPFCKEGVVLEKKESVSKILGLVTMYNQKLSQYVKDYRNYGTPQKLRSDVANPFDLPHRTQPQV